MNDFIIIKRIANSDSEYLLWILDISKSITSCVYYDRSDQKINDRKIDENEILENFVCYDYETKLEEKDLTKYLEPREININDFSIYRFDQLHEPALRKFTYSLKKNKSVFVPCCGKHPDHKNINWGKYVNDFQIDDLLIEGYIVLDTKKFDSYILGIQPSFMHINYIGNSEIVLSEFKDYINSFSDFDSIIIKFKSGKNIEFK